MRSELYGRWNIIRRGGGGWGQNANSLFLYSTHVTRSKACPTCMHPTCAMFRMGSGLYEAPLMHTCG